jgi:hypothetical protein
MGTIPRARDGTRARGWAPRTGLRCSVLCEMSRGMPGGSETRTYKNRDKVKAYSLGLGLFVDADSLVGHISSAALHTIIDGHETR